MAGNDYSLSGVGPGQLITAPDLLYKPCNPRAFHPGIGLIGCGGITHTHLSAYRKAGYNVVALCDRVLEKARERQAEFYPDALVTTDVGAVLARNDIEVVDIATHVGERVVLIEEALQAGKHVLSQKPFVLDLDTGQRLVELARAQKRKLAVNQNGRWAPHFSYLRQAVASGLIGDLLSLHLDVHWDHTWIKGRPFEQMRDIVLYDFAIHWFDLASHLLRGRTVRRVYASRTRALGQEIAAPLLAQAALEFDGGQASLGFDAHLPFGSRDRTFVGGTIGTIVSEGPNLNEQRVTLYTAAGHATPTLAGAWFPDGFHGTMAELLCAIEEDREPSNGAQENLDSLALCFAAIASATDNLPKTPGEIRRLPPGSVPGN